MLYLFKHSIWSGLAPIKIISFILALRLLLSVYFGKKRQNRFYNYTDVFDLILCIYFTHTFLTLDPNLVIKDLF
jgi:hypothetical protein